MQGRFGEDVLGSCIAITLTGRLRDHPTSFLSDIGYGYCILTIYENPSIPLVGKRPIYLHKPNGDSMILFSFIRDSIISITSTNTCPLIAFKASCFKTNNIQYYLLIQVNTGLIQVKLCPVICILLKPSDQQTELTLMQCG